MKTEFFRKIFEKIFQYPISFKIFQLERNCSMQTDGQIYMANLIVTFLSFANAFKNSVIYIQNALCLARGSYPPPNRLLQTIRSSASAFKFQYRLFSSSSSGRFLRLLPSLPLTFILPSTDPSTTCFISQFLRKKWPIQLLFLLFIVCRIILFSLTLRNASSFLIRSVQLIFVILLHTTTQNFAFWSAFRSVHFSAPYKATY